MENETKAPEPTSEPSLEIKPGYKSSHQIARELLALPDLTCIVPTLTFDMPGGFTALPARVDAITIEGVRCVAVGGGKPEKSEARE